jgi:hypothetical protein
MYFITDVFLSDGCDQLWVIIDCFIMMGQFMALKKKETKAENLVLVFAYEIWRLHRIPTDIVSDWDWRFTSIFWKACLMAIGVKPWILTAFYPETDGKSEQVKQTIEAFLRALVKLKMSHWVEL